MRTVTPPTVGSGRPTRLTRVLTFSVLLVVTLTAACGTGDTGAIGTDTPVGSAPENPGGDQRELTARIKEIYTASASIEFDELDVLTGDDARRAAIEAGAIEPGEDVPNDVWLLEGDDVTERFTVDPAAVVWIYDCTGACERVRVDLGAFLRHEVQPYGGDFAVWEITITEGMITSLLEVYLP
ncbi:MAG TPA: hypothetical protein VLB67_01020 [Acidimicrobiia bacterium]|nr:hypothetical protein [Acidimicrobiia bacterium]